MIIFSKTRIFSKYDLQEYFIFSTTFFYIYYISKIIFLKKERNQNEIESSSLVAFNLVSQNIWAFEIQIYLP